MSTPANFDAVLSQWVFDVCLSEPRRDTMC